MGKGREKVKLDFEYRDVSNASNDAFERAAEHYDAILDELPHVVGRGDCAVATCPCCETGEAIVVRLEMPDDPDDPPSVEVATRCGCDLASVVQPFGLDPGWYVASATITPAYSGTHRGVTCTPGIQDQLAETLVAACDTLVADVATLHDRYVELGGSSSAFSLATSSRRHGGVLPPEGGIDVASLVVDAGPEPEPVIDGLIRPGETGNLIGSTKTAKSWFVTQLLISVATGQSVLGFRVPRPRRVLLLDNELRRTTLRERFVTVAAAMGVDLDDLRDWIHILPLRGQLRDVHEIGRLLAKTPPGQYGLIVLDALYRAFPVDVDENSNAQVARVFNTIDALADRLEAAWINVHHATKGDQSGKSVTDVGSGAGSQSRAVDNHLVLRPHEADGCVVLEGALRSFRGFPPVVLRRVHPLWHADSNLDPGRLKHPQSGRVMSPQEFADVVLGDRELTTSKLTELARSHGMSVRSCNAARDAAVAAGIVERRQTRQNKAATFLRRRDSDATECHDGNGREG